MGQNTGTSNIPNNVNAIAISTAFIHAYQNLNSGKRRMNGLNSNSLSPVVGSSGRSSVSVN